MRIFITSFLFLLLYAPLKAQDKFFLKNGSIIKGKYVHKLSTDTTIFVSVEGGEIVIPQASLAYAKFKRHYGLEEESEQQSRFKPPAPGFYSAVSLGANIGSHSQYYSTVTPGLEIVAGYRWDRFKNIGGGVTMDLYEMFYAAPIYVHYEVDIGYQRVSPYAWLDAGYGHVWKKTVFLDQYEINGGPFFSTGFGYKVKLRNNDLRLALGFKTQQARLKLKDELISPWGGGFNTRRQNMNRLTAKVGLTF